LKTWGGRISRPSDALFEAFTSSVEDDRVLARYDVRVSRAHARELGRIGLLSDQEVQSLVLALDEIEAELEQGAFVWRDDLEDVHTHVEVNLRERVGGLAGALHAGRSRNDQVASDLRLYVADQTMNAMAMVLDLQAALLLVAERHTGDTMPGYSHLQQAQPVVIAFPLLAHSSMLGRDWERLENSLSRCRLSPLGSGAVAGSTFSLDRQRLARDAGFDTPMDNALDAVGDRDFVNEFIFAAALCMVHLSRLAQDFIIWSSVEFGFVRLPDAFSSGSSMMPQKKNPDVLELVRGKAAQVQGNLTASLGIVTGLSLGYSRDLQEQKRPLFEATDTLLATLEIVARFIPLVEFDVERAKDAIGSFAMATDLADHLVRGGLPFRDAHTAVGQLVTSFLTSGRELQSATPTDLHALGVDVTEIPALSPEASVTAKATLGSTNPVDVRRQIEHARQTVESRRHEGQDTV
jgi:argininosuccinate lyase